MVLAPKPTVKLVSKIKAMYSRQDYALTVTVFRMLFGLLYFGVFATHMNQVSYMYGSRGILPVADFVGRAHPSFINFPTLHLFLNSDFAITAMVVLGMIFALTLAMGYFPKTSLVACFVLFLSMVTAGRDFFYFQWDFLLLEATFLAMFLPFRGKPFKGVRIEPTKIVVFLFLFLLFKVYFESGIIKVLFGQADWLKLSAMQHYYETAPLPSLGGYLMQQVLAPWLHSITALLVLFVELAFPFLFFFPRKYRLASFYISLAFQILIMLTSNYGYFNWLMIVLSVFLLDDEHIKGLLHKAGINPGNTSANKPTKAAKYISIALVLAVLYFSAAEYSRAVRPGALSDKYTLKAQEAYEPFRIINRYHLFATIVPNRNIIQIEGFSTNWKPLFFKNTNQETGKAPPQIIFYQDRFAFLYSFMALSRVDTEVFQNVISKTCSNTSDLMPLLADRKIAYEKFSKVRLKLYRYQFTKPSKLYSSGEWWEKELIGTSPEISC